MRKVTAKRLSRFAEATGRGYDGMKIWWGRLTRPQRRQAAGEISHYLAGRKLVRQGKED